MITNNTSGPRAAMGGTSREARFQEVLARWPVLAEQWARDLEDRRTSMAQANTPPAARAGTNAVDLGITPLEAINRALGLPDDHGAGEVGRRRGE